MSDDQTIKVFLVDDHPLVRDGIFARLENTPNIDIVGQASNGKEALENAGDLQPDIVLMDVSMPIMGGLEATALFKEQFPNIKILILSMHDEQEYIIKLMKIGASGYVLKDVSSAELINAIQTVAQGNTSFCSGASHSLFNSSTSISTVIDNDVLSKREIDILKQVASGQCNKNIARQLDISVRTVETHRLNIKAKLDIKTTAGITRYAIENNIV